MTEDRYNELINNQEVLKINGELDFQCICKCKRYCVGVYYNPISIEKKVIQGGEEKPILGVYPYDETSDLPHKELESSEIIFLMLPNEQSLAFTFKLFFDCDKGAATLKVLDMPEINYGVVTQKEVNGITKKIHPAHKKYVPKP